MREDRASGRARSTESLMLMLRPGRSFHFQRRVRVHVWLIGGCTHAHSLKIKCARGLNSSDPSNGLEEPQSERTLNDQSFIRSLNDSSTTSRSLTKTNNYKPA
jgi:hypothetical protein